MKGNSGFGAPAPKMPLWGDTMTWFQKHVVEPSIFCLHSIKVLHVIGNDETQERYLLEAPIYVSLVE
jgi:hypothetical protein